MSEPPAKKQKVEAGEASPLWCPHVVWLQSGLDQTLVCVCARALAEVSEVWARAFEHGTDEKAEAIVVNWSGRAIQWLHRWSQWRDPDELVRSTDWDFLCEVGCMTHSYEIVDATQEVWNTLELASGVVPSLRLLRLEQTIGLQLRSAKKLEWLWTHRHLVHCYAAVHRSDPDLPTVWRYFEEKERDQYRFDQMMQLMMCESEASLAVWPLTPHLDRPLTTDDGFTLRQFFQRFSKCEDELKALSTGRWTDGDVKWVIDRLIRLRIENPRWLEVAQDPKRICFQCKGRFWS